VPQVGLVRLQLHELKVGCLTIAAIDFAPRSYCSYHWELVTNICTHSRKLACKFEFVWGSVSGRLHIHIFIIYLFIYLFCFAILFLDDSWDASYDIF
jgi:hypothetical protein